MFPAGDIKLHIPELDQEAEVEALLASPEVLEKLEQCVMNWQTQITIVIEEQQKKKPQVNHGFPLLQRVFSEQFSRMGSRPRMGGARRKLC